jgi:hypothetical protein
MNQCPGECLVIVVATGLVGGQALRYTLENPAVTSVVLERCWQPFRRFDSSLAGVF